MHPDGISFFSWKIVWDRITCGVLERKGSHILGFLPIVTFCLDVEETVSHVIAQDRQIWIPFDIPITIVMDPSLGEAFLGLVKSSRIKISVQEIGV